jgi:Fe-S cluster assembly ATP-binding protein
MNEQMNYISTEISTEVQVELELINLHVEVDGKEIIKGVSLKFEQGKIHALMGPNGSGKSTLANAIVGNPKYKITQGKILLNGQDITYAKPDLRAREGLFLSFQYPAEISGVSISTFLRSAVNSGREKKYSVIEFHKLLKQTMGDLGIDSSFSRRDLNAGFSGGEKKRAEMLQLAMLKPKFSLLDETDSGLDVDAIKIVANTIDKIKGETNMGILLITHYNKFLQYLKPDQVSIIFGGKIVKQGDYQLAHEIEENGFEGIVNG